MRLLRSALFSMIVVILVWQALVLVVAPPSYMLPSPLAVADVLGAQTGFLARQTLTTLTEIILGLAFGTALGVATALAITVSPRLGSVVWPLLLTLQAFPVFAIAPLLVLWFGFGITSKVVMATLIIFFPIASAFADGLRRTDQHLLEASALLGASRFQTFRFIRIPLAIPGLMSGLRVAAPLAPLGAVIGEWVGASGGLGFTMVTANARMQTDMLFATLAILAALTLILRFLVDELARTVAPWQKETS
ncbi:ABC transporter permease [Rhizobium sp. CFBP 8762]|uniref:ABC transporter permease n=1 Tax=Rhizobium sp. CFBP 8762 TaxID=2775279 RepID=UPI00177A9EB2|nr:ABC transporter permease [Rhizobium sp. CFBP 8762]MBD8555295.1 ABC transporter permease [Rhizobium sp. CFBP 8762]